MPIVSFKTKAEIPEGLQDIAKEVNGVFQIEVVAKAKLDEFRENNVTIARERDELKNKVAAYAAVAGDDPEKFSGELNTLRQQDQLVKDGKLKGSEAVESEVARRVASVKESLEGQIRTLAAERDREKARGDTAESQFKRSIIDREVTNAVLAQESGINPSALPDILSRAYAVYQVGDNNRLIAKQGDAVIYGSDGATPIQPKEWLGKLVQEAPHFAKLSTGGGASGGAEKKFGGLSEAEFQKLPPMERISRYREAQAG